MVTTMSHAHNLAGARRELGAGLLERLVAQQRVGARSALEQDVDAFGLQLAHDLGHQSNSVLARRGLLRYADPHMRCGNVSDRNDGAVRPVSARPALCETRAL